MSILSNRKINALPTIPPSGYLKVAEHPSTKLRVLLLPDWQGGGTSYMQRMAAHLNKHFAAETIILHQYKPEFSPQSYPIDGRPAVRQLLRDRRSSRAWMEDILLKIQPQWQHEECPLLLIGFCLGGTLAFEAARQCNAADIAISVHGNPGTDLTLASEHSNTSMVYIRGGSDPLIPDIAEEQFFHEMQNSDRQWFCHTIGSGRHSFTKEEVGCKGPGSVFDEQAMNLSFQMISCHVNQLLTHYHQKTARISA